MKRDAWAGRCNFVYLTPELAVMSLDRLTELHQIGEGIGLIAVDEAHCISGEMGAIFKQSGAALALAQQAPSCYELLSSLALMALFTLARYTTCN